MNNKLIMIVCLVSLLMLGGCKGEEKQAEDNFEVYCASYCMSAGMNMASWTSTEEHTYNCVCQKIFLKEEWEKQNG